MRRIWKKRWNICFSNEWDKSCGSFLIITTAEIEQSRVWSCMDRIEFTVRVTQLHGGSGDPWLETIRSLMINKVFDMDVNNLKCRRSLNYHVEVNVYISFPVGVDLFLER